VENKTGEMCDAGKLLVHARWGEKRKLRKGGRSPRAAGSEIKKKKGVDARRRPEIKKERKGQTEGKRRTSKHKKKKRKGSPNVPLPSKGRESGGPNDWDFRKILDEWAGGGEQMKNMYRLPRTGSPKKVREMRKVEKEKK